MSDLPAVSAVRRRGLMLVLSSPSGAGKTTISRAILQSDPGITMSVSVTTRPPRPGEIDGKDYFFVDKAHFDEMVKKGELLEHARVFDNYYGTPRARVEKALAEGRDVLFDVDWQGTQQLGDNARADLVTVFVLPPSLAELERRLRGRAQDPEDVVKKRMSKAAVEMSHYFEYTYIVINDDVDKSIEAVRSILAAERLRKDRQIGLAEFVGGMTGN